MRHDDDGSDYFSEAFAREAAPIEHEHHPDLDLLFASLEGELASELQSKLSAHLATCETCRLRWNQLAGHLQEAASIHGTRSRVPALDAFVGERATPRTTLTDWLRSLFETRAYVVVAASAAALALTLAVAIPLVRAPTVRTSEQIRVLDDRIAILQNKLDTLSQIGSNVPNQGFTPPGIVVADLAQFDWRTLTPYTVRTGDNWEGIAERLLGNADLWPLVWLLNSEVGSPDAPPPPDQIIQLPTPRSGP